MTLTDLLDEKVRAKLDARFPGGWWLAWEGGKLVIRGIEGKDVPAGPLTLALGAEGMVEGD